MKKLLLVALVAGGVSLAAPSANACHAGAPGNPRCWAAHACEPLDEVLIADCSLVQ